MIVTRSGRHRLLTVPDLQASPPATPSSGHIAAFQRYARATRFTAADGAARGGLVPSPTWAANPRLIEGDVDDLLQTLGASARRRLLLGLAAALAAAGLVAAFVASFNGD